MSDIEQLKSLLEGARIISVNESKNPESLCSFCIETDDGRTSFTLYATDLGHWCGDVIRNGAHVSMTDMLDSIYNHVYVCQKIINHIGEHDSIGYFECDCGQMFIVLGENISDAYKNILKDDEAMRKLAGLLSEQVYICSAKSLSKELNREIDGN